jgi:hypothetical protein
MVLASLLPPTRSVRALEEEERLKPGEETTSEIVVELLTLP